MTLTLDSGSFRDPAGHVFQVDGRILRTITQRASEDFLYLKDRPSLRSWIDAQKVIGFKEVSRREIEVEDLAVQHIVEHPRLPFISYPYEWSFSALKAAALLHLELQLDALKEDVALSDASAYNIQFVGTRPIFIDLLSFRKYREGELWEGHQQFCDQFLNPLLLRAYVGIPHNSWFRGNLEGISTTDLSRLLPWKKKWSWNVLSHVVLPARMQKASVGEFDTDKMAAAKERTLSRSAYNGLLIQLRDWIAKLTPHAGISTTWGQYAENTTYQSDEEANKSKFISSFVERAKPAMVWDIGCNTGAYSEVALDAGAEMVIGFDYDQDALEAAFARGRDKKLQFLPLFLDIVNPSPGQGWRHQERMSLQERASADALIALAFVHHLAIARNIPIDQVVDWVVGLAPTGVIEFVQKTDPTVRHMLALREDIFDNYTEDAFRSALEARAHIVACQTVSASGRQLYHFDRR